MKPFKIAVLALICLNLGLLLPVWADYRVPGLLTASNEVIQRNSTVEGGTFVNDNTELPLPKSLQVVTKSPSVTVIC